MTSSPWHRPRTVTTSAAVRAVMAAFVESCRRSGHQPCCDPHSPRWVSNRCPGMSATTAAFLESSHARLHPGPGHICRVTAYHIWVSGQNACPLSSTHSSDSIRLPACTASARSPPPVRRSGDYRDGLTLRQLLTRAKAHDPIVLSTGAPVRDRSERRPSAIIGIRTR